MITSARRARALLASASVLASVLAASPLADPPAPAPASPSQCLLERVGVQYVRCDDLTGLGAAAPEWIPEQR